MISGSDSQSVSIKRMMYVFSTKKAVLVRGKCFFNAEILLLSYITSIYDLFLPLVAVQTANPKAIVTLKLSFKESSL